MTLKLYNTLSRTESPFSPLSPPQVRIYCCGVTVYDYCHLGHARSYIVWDTLRRYLQWCGFQVNYVQNFTDIDDKILNRARQTGSTMQAVASRFTQTYFEDMARLNVLEADEYPRATHAIDGIQRLIYELEQKGYAYSADGDVYYHVRQYPEYGKLSRRQLEEMQTGASGRVQAAVDEAQKKKDPYDFALWKAAKPEEPSWPSPWGAGRPGWHIECSAMVRDRLGDSIDIHCGGADLIFPHHENEIAQSEAVTGKPLAQYWLHNGFVTVNGEKMSKSLGNFTTIRQLLDGENAPSPMAVRLFVLQGHYRKPIDFTPEAIASAQNSWETLKDGLLFCQKYGKKLEWTETGSVLKESVVKFQMAMDDDLNTPGALAVLFELAKELKREGNILVHAGITETDPQILQEQWYTLVSLGKVLGLEARLEEEKTADDGLSDAEIEALIEQRSQARKAKNFAEGDRIRNELQARGITLLDKPGGITSWHRK
ncbi:MAG: cysteine--tRNA ligase [Hormoscilla sp. GM102CHS1]|nr:cysteine--tRNA ligase [Hormoscilla sp. GM102CHS1]